MNHIQRMLRIASVSIVLMVFVIIGCLRTNEPAIDEGEEESSTELALDEAYDKVRNGARLILKYDLQSNAFKGTVENTTDETLKQVRVEIHLSNGKELGPTTPGDLAPGEKRGIQLTATSTNFDGWTAHPEVGEGEHSHGEDDEHGRKGEHSHEEEGGEHGKEGEGEHD